MEAANEHKIGSNDMKIRFYVIALLIAVSLRAHADYQLVDDFDRADMWYHGDGWETLTRLCLRRLLRELT